MDSFISWVGGKRLLRKEIIKRFPTEGVEKYVEPFGGAAWVLFGKEPHKKEVYNDINGELVNMFRMAKYHPEALERETGMMLNSREEFFRQRNMKAETMTELQRAARMYYLIRASYGAKVNTFGVGFRDVSAMRNLQAVHKRLAKVLIENKGFAEILKGHDSEKTLFFLDPPYHGTEMLYEIEGGFGEEEHRQLAEMLRGPKGKWILSYNDDDFIRGLYEGYRMEEVERLNNMGEANGGEKTFRELIIRNY